LEEARDKLEREKQDIMEEFRKTTLDVNQMKRLLEMDKAKIEDLTHQRNILTKNINKAETDVETQKSQRKIAEGNRRNVLTKQKAYAGALEDLRLDERRLKKETEKYVEELNQARQRYEQAIEEGKIKRMETEELQERIRDGQEKLKQQQALYEAVRSERNSYSKLLIDATEEIEAMNRSKKIMNTQIKKLRAEIEKRQDELLEQSAKQEKVKNTIERIKKQIITLEKEIKEQESINRQHEEEIYKLNQIIKDADMERKRQQKEYESVMNDRDILGAQLIKRNDELAHLYEKIKSQQSALKKGQHQFMEKSQEIDTLRKHISLLHKKQVELKDEISSMDELSTSVHALKRELLQENMKIRSLQDELENPMNVHRWRKLEGSDPHSFKMIQQIQALQKKLIEKTEEVMEKDMLIQQKEKLYLELKEVLIRQPGPEVAEQVNALQSTLKSKTKEYNKMNEDLRACVLLTKEQTNEQERLLKELAEIKAQYYSQRKMAQQQSQVRQSVFDDEEDELDILR
jgi:chromosome segregation ATPase